MLVQVSAALVLAVILIAARATDIATADLVRDPTAVLNGPFHAGALSNIGVLGWTAAAAISGFGAAVVGRTDPDHGFLLATSLLTTALALDDFFLVHDEIAPDHLGIDENLVLALLAIGAATYAWRFRRSLVAIPSHTLLAVTAVAWFAASVFLDVIGDDWFGDQHFFVEDGCKFLGIASWAAFVVASAAHRVLNRSATAPR